eukprot:1032892-Amphidinium_carterae.1
MELQQVEGIKGHRPPDHRVLKPHLCRDICGGAGRGVMDDQLAVLHGQGGLALDADEFILPFKTLIGWNVRDRVLILDRGHRVEQ